MSDINSHRPKSYADLHQRIMGKAEVVHSNVFAQEAHGDRIGSTSHETFGQRVDLQNNRQTIRSYRESAIGGANSAFRSSLGENNRGSVTSQGRPAYQKPSPQQRSFQEPTVRRYNPYG